MGKEETLKTTILQSIINYVRENHKEAIDKAYDYFWDERLPDEFLQGTSLALGFMNFEDWLVFDYKTNDKKETFIDIYINEKQSSAEELELLNKIKTSNISLYEVASVSREKRIVVNDLLLEGEFSLRDKKLTRGLKKGDIFTTRLLHLDGGYVMSGCVYPFRVGDKKKVLKYIDRMFGRYKRNENPDGTMRDFLKDYGDVFNMAWMNLIIEPLSDDV